ncbi:hypothetical protein GQ457_09G018640 [Hibiscus cannabinus]
MVGETRRVHHREVSEQLGVASVESVLANLLHWFDLKLLAGETAENLDISEVYDITTTKKTPLHVLPTSHSSF